jgi:hypothetical protein
VADKKSDKTICPMSAEEVLSELKAIAQSNLQHYKAEIRDGQPTIALTSDAPENAWRAVQAYKRKVFVDSEGSITKVEIDVKEWNKLEALRLIGQYLGMWSGKDDGSELAPSKVYQVRINPGPPDADD